MATIKEKQIIDIARKCSDAIYDVLLRDSNFDARKFNIGANDICDIITNKIISLLENGNN